MKVGRLVAVTCLTSLALAGCKDQQARDEIAALKTELAAVKGDFQEYKDWLGISSQAKKKSDKSVHTWHDNVYKAICNLEDKAKPPVADRLCHASGDHGSAPQPPPWL